MTAPSERGRLATLLVLLFASGASGLAYQVLWLRELSLLLGVTVYAAATVLAAFMGGLVLGSAAAGRVAARVRDPLLAFGAAEVLIGSSAIAVSAAFDRAAPVDLLLHDWLGGSGAALTAGRFVAAVTLLLVPTSLMGLTMPLASSTAIVRASFGERLGLVYGMNTAGGVLGACATGFYVFPETTAWVGGTLLVGSDAPLAISRAAFERQLTDPATREAMAAVDLTSIDALTGWYSAGPATLRAFVGPGPLLTDDRPTVEYFGTLPPGEPAARLDRLRDDVRTTVVP